MLFLRFPEFEQVPNSVSMEFADYRPVPKSVAEELIEQLRKKKKEQGK